MTTRRLTLRPLHPDDAERLPVLAGVPEVASATLHPLPFLSGERAGDYIAGQAALFREHVGATFAVAENSGEQPLCGCVSLRCDFAHRHAELRYWIGLPYWNNGYATEAVRCLIGYGFGHFRFNRVHASHLASNPASGRVLEKIGFQKEGQRREHVFLAGLGWDDVIDYGILLHEWAEVAHRDL